MKARVWFDRSDNAKPWLIAYESGRVARAEWVMLASAQTEFDNDAFMDLPGGPKATITGYVIKTTGEVNAFGAPV